MNEILKAAASFFHVHLEAEKIHSLFNEYQRCQIGSHLQDHFEACSDYLSFYQLKSSSSLFKILKTFLEQTKKKNREARNMAGKENP